jgi:16S rRNA (cytosine967-C5)-methyltransferase
MRINGRKEAAVTKDAERPGWAWWDNPEEDLPLRHAVRILRSAGSLEELVFAGGPPLDRALRSHQTQNRKMGRSDRLLLGTALYALARNRELYRRALPEAVPGDSEHLLLALLDGHRGDPGKVPHLPGGPLRWVRLLEAVSALRDNWVSILTQAWKLPARGAPPPVREALEGLLGIPHWWIEQGPWDRVGEVVKECARLKRPQRLILRAYPATAAAREDALRRLRAEGIACRPTHRSPWGLVVAGRHNVLASPAYREGRIEVQDEGSQLVACLCDPKPGEKVLDFCAGGGGKALALGAAMEGRGSVVAYDADARRLADARRRARRAGLGNVRVVADPSEVAKAGPYDLVLVDAPCSSSGTLRRNPDVAWRWSAEDVRRLGALQAQILDHAAALVRPGGLLVYATCSLLEPENGAQARGLLERRREFRPAPPGDRKGHAPLLDVPGAGEGAFRLAATLPQYDGDAFFLARFRREG